MVVRDDGGGACAIALLGGQRYWGMRAVAGVGRRAKHCRGGRAAVTELATRTRTANDPTRGEGQMMKASNKSGHSMMQGDDDGSDGSSGMPH